MSFDLQNSTTHADFSMNPEYHSRRLDSRLLSLTLLLVCALPAALEAKVSPWTKSNRIAISADGNPDADHDDIGATPFTIAVLARAGLQQNLVHYDFNNFLEYKPIPAEKNEMWRGAMGGQSRWGFDASKFFDAAQDPAAAIGNLRKEINKSTPDDPLYLIEAGPLELIYLALESADSEARKHVILVSHSGYNDYYKPRLWQRNLNDVFALVPKITHLKIPDQNRTLRTEPDYTPWHWLRDHADPNLNWVYERLDTGLADVSDTGMLCWLIGLSGEDQQITVDELKEWFGSKPIPTNGGIADSPQPPNAKAPRIKLPVTKSIFQEVGGKIVIEAESVPPSGDWKLESTEEGFTGEGYLRYLPSDINSFHSQSRGVLTYKLRISEAGKYRMALKHSNKGAPGPGKWNDCWTLMGIDPAPWGLVRRTFHSIDDEEFEAGAGFTFQTTHANYGPVARSDGEFSKPVYELSKGDHYFFVLGRSGGYRLDKIHFFKEGVDGFQDDSLPSTPVLTGSGQ